MNKMIYRYEIKYKSEYGDTSVYLSELPVIRETEKTYLIKRTHWGSDLRRVSKDAYNSYAFDTKKEAKSHFIRRTSKRIEWFEFWTKECEKALELINE